jgi:hypothetical protein
MRLEIFVLVVAFVNLAVVLEFVRQRRLGENFALLWTGIALGAFALILLRPVIDRFAELVGIESGTSVVFSLGILFLLIVSVYLSVQITKLNGRVESLAEEVALLRGVRRPEQAPDPGGDPT